MSRIGIIGGTGLSDLAMTRNRLENSSTPYGLASDALVCGEVAGHEVLFLSRHGNPPVVAAHAVNYRANMWLLHQAGADMVIAVNTVGGIQTDLRPGDLMLPDQIIDYTWGREHTYSNPEDLQHVDFSYPYDQRLNEALLSAASVFEAKPQVIDGGTYACTQGPRLETAAEIVRYARDGCAVVGMTAMPEASLARELALPYASICLVVNMAAGLAENSEAISLADMRQINIVGMRHIHLLLQAFLERLPLLD